MPSAHRHLVHRHMRRPLSKRTRDLLPGEVRFFPYYQPSLQGGIHTVEVGQEVTVPGQGDTEKITGGAQDFNVIAPRFNLPPGVVDSVYPPPGTSAPVTILPHIVFKDPHLPWEQDATFVDMKEEQNDVRSHTPWLLLLTFTPEELKLGQDSLAAILDGLLDVKVKQSETMAVRMQVMQAQSLKRVVNAIPYDKRRDEHDAEGPVDVIFLKKDLFLSLFTDPVAKNNVLDVSYIVVAPRTSPLDSEVPVTNIVHLVSLNTVPSRVLTPELSSDKDRVALVSLYSWSYTCIPSEGDGSLRARLVHLGKNLTQDGYTLVRHRTITGETTAAMLRGPFPPSFVPRLERDGFAMQSNFGPDLQILDPTLSLMDITYASAWQLGKTLAMGDEAFCAALTRLRNLIHGDSLGASKIDVHDALGLYRSRADTLGTVGDLVRGLNGLNETLHEGGDGATAVDSNRWDYTHPTSFPLGGQGTHRLDISMHSPHISARIASHANAAALAQAMATDGELYNEHKVPENADFAHVYSWVLDKLHLANNWTDALVDGALSLANHWASTPKDDLCRTAIKKAIQKRLDEPDPSLGGWHVQMPQYGFILRSQLLVKFPDIAVSVEYADARTKEDEPPKAPILVQKALSADTMYCLFDCTPPDLKSITFTMPPHQQRFAIGSNITDTALAVAVKKVYTEPDPSKRQDKEYKTAFPGTSFPMDVGEVFDLKSRTINVKPYVTHIFKTLKKNMDAKDFKDDAPSSTLLALQLNESIPELLITLPRISRPGSNTRNTFRFSLPTTVKQTPPPLSPLPRNISRPVKTRIAHSRPRPPSPRREAALIAQRARNLDANPAIPLPCPPSRLACQPQFIAAVYALRNRSYITTSSPLPVDLIVKIVRHPKSVIPIYALKDIEVERVPLLATGADPPTATMLSNLRFNILQYYPPSESKDKGTLNFKLVPRSKDGVTIDKFKEASFLISRAQIVRYMGRTERESQVDITFSSHVDA
ncbi:hypothetical protein B0T26DRAFT_739368 [Lasiosphaeria miniovina]|uniref:Uncharacterized protein n=1 Tax=Lasiosphaeria miniovina TaxID=1954250 RepID=A0AA40AU48_9PEZI|nr:uncharacterized protein B0T26DRAFT_739368 [Lasiosphaeria miniovina]KAK0722056.1 hypothetical protein B0T26DRAFT_739368 [Lasiosphaeria miniovina]